MTSRGKQVLQRTECRFIRRIVVGGHDDTAVADVEVCVAGRDSLVLDVLRLRQVERHHFQPATVLVTQGTELLQVVAKRFVIGVIAIPLCGGHNRGGVDEAPVGRYVRRCRPPSVRHD